MKTVRMKKVSTFAVFEMLLYMSVMAFGNLAANAHEGQHEAQYKAQHTDSQAPVAGSMVQYLGNEALLFSDGDTKVLFDPFFHNDYGSYQLVPESVRDAIFAGEAPFDNVSAIVVSHAHGDHFAADDVANYLAKHPHCKLIAPSQATDQVVSENKELASQLVAIKLGFGDAPVTTTVKTDAGDIVIDSVRIPHAGWPQRKDIANLVHRVTLTSGKTVMHMGDADPNDTHFAPFVAHWQKTQSDAAFPPYWFFISEQGPMILKSRINALKSVGVHVPVNVPAPLVQSGGDYFSTPLEIRPLD